MVKNIGVISDIHLEGSNMQINNPGWDYLAIVGDLAAIPTDLLHFFAYGIPDDVPVIYILGNHEYEAKVMQDAEEKLRQLLRPFENVHILNNETLVVDNIKFIGTTLWTDFALDGNVEKNKEWAGMHVADFSHIRYRDSQNNIKCMTADKMVQLNTDARNFLHHELCEVPFDGKKVVLSHFAPHANSVNPEYKHKNASYWVTNCEDLMGFSEYWFHGHTHDTFNYNVKGTQVICNPRGFSKTYNMPSNVHFDPQLMIPIEVSPKMKIKF